MKKRLKGLISWWLVLAMIFSSVTVSFATESVEVQSTYARYYKGSEALKLNDNVWILQKTSAIDDLYYGEGADTLKSQVSSLEEENRPENKILVGWNLWAMHNSGDLDAGPIVKSLTDVVTTEDIETCLKGSGDRIDDNYYDPLVEPHYVDKYIIDPQPTNESFTVGGKEYNINDDEYYETADFSCQWFEISATEYSVVNGNDGDTTIGARRVYKGSCSDEGIWSGDSIDIEFDVEAGDVIKVTPIVPDASTDTTATVSTYGRSDYYTLTDGSYIKEMTSEDRYNIHIRDFAEGVTFKIEVIRYGEPELLEGQTDVTLDTDGLDDGIYFCRLTFDESGENIVLDSEGVEFAYTAPAHEHPICGDAECASHGDDVTFEPWTATDSLPTSGNYYLTSDVTLSAIYEPFGTVNLCLNGYKISSTRNSNVVYVDSGKTLNICDCIGNGKITGDHSAATINVKGTASLHSGTVENKNSNGYPGISLDSGSLTVTGGTVTSSKISSDGIGIGVYAGTLTLSGAPTISGTAADINLKGNGNAVITVDGSLSNTTPYKVRLTYYDELPYTIVTANATDYSDRFEAVNSNYGLYYDTTSQCVKLANVENIPVIHRHPICGDTECTSHGSGVTYTAWNGTGTPSGNVYLTDNVTLTESLIISSGTVNLCLNGHTITITDSQDAFYVESGATLNICECSTNQSGKIEKTSASADYPGILNRGGTVNVYSGTVSSSNNSNGSNGIYNHSGTVNVYQRYCQ